MQTKQNRKEYQETGRRTKELEQLQHSSRKMQEVTSMQFTEKNKKRYVILHLSIAEILLITQQCDVQVYK